MRVSNGTAALFHDDARQRVLLACFGVSIALHALLLFAFPLLRTGTYPDDFKALTATFAPRPATEGVTAVPEPRLKPPERPTEAKPPLPLPALAEAPTVAPVVPQPAAPASSPAPSDPGVSPPDASRAPETHSAEAAAKPPIERFDAGLVEAYRLALIDAAKHHKRYPVQARERGWQGRVEIRVVIGADGTIKRTHVKTSSNYQILDDQALDMVNRGLTPIPPALRGREFSVDVPVIFELQTG